MNFKHWPWSIVVSVVLIALPLICWGQEPQPVPEELRTPSSTSINDYERKLYRWLIEQQYNKLNWHVDKSVRDTGPFLERQNYGTHPAVRIYYSPEVVKWLELSADMRKETKIDDGAMIVKEMFIPPVALYTELPDVLLAVNTQALKDAGKYDENKQPQYEQEAEAQAEELLSQLVTAWTVMVKDSKGSKDGWFWAGPGAPQAGETVEQAIEGQLEDYEHLLYSGFGLPCLRCHASAEDELTFSALENMKGFAGEPLRFRVDTAWRSNAYLSQYPLSRIPQAARGMMVVPAKQRPWMEGVTSYFRQHMRPSSSIAEVTANPLEVPNPAFVETFKNIDNFSQLSNVARTNVKTFPMQWADHVVAPPGDPNLYITSDNCLGCHGGLGGAPSGVTMFIDTGPKYGDGYNVSEYGEWRWSPMGLAGRDPIFHAQLESEMAILERDAKQKPSSPLKGSLEENKQAVINTCVSCHGAMGQRQLWSDATNNVTLPGGQPLDKNFKTDYFYLVEQLSATDPKPANADYHKYGELAREGISCTICHHINRPNPDQVAKWKPTDGWITDSTPKELAYFLFHNTTGQYKAGAADSLHGPFEKVAELPMKNALGITPKYDAFITDSQMCGTCHTINLPNIGMTEDTFPVLTVAETNPALKPYSHTIEQATFLEWQNSAFGVPGENFKSCQDCHMPGGFKTLDGEIDIPRLVTQIATIQDTTYPEAEHEASPEEIDVPLRNNYKRHEHVGLNVFLLEMFNQFPSILGVDKTDYMTSATTGNALALENMVRQAQEETIDLNVAVTSFENNVLTTDVTVTNKVGHRFPSGVAFRRAFLEFLVLYENDVIWGSGRTNSVGVIVDENGKPLPTEFLPNEDTYQRHHQTIKNQSEVQIYEELSQNADSKFTTSFIHRVKHIKDNRLLPKGWLEAKFFEDQGKVMYEFMESTDPKHTDDDPDYQNPNNDPNFPGKDSLTYEARLPSGLEAAKLSVKVTMYYQAIPPYYMHQRFSSAPDSEATKRLYYLTSHLKLNGTAMENWKLRLVSETEPVVSNQNR